MRVVMASDHAGFELKRSLVEHARGRGFEVVDLGTGSLESVDYPDFAHLVATCVAAGEAERGVLICGTGIGMSIAANRHARVRAALCHDAFTAEASRRHNDANVLCLGGRTTGPGVALQILEIFLAVPFEGGRHTRRVEKIEERQGTGVRGPGSGPPPAQ